MRFATDRPGQPEEHVTDHGQVKSPEPGTEDPRVVEERIIRLAFSGDRERWAQFTSALREVIPRDVQVILRGSAVTGYRWKDKAPFDADGPGTSDMDLTFVGGDMLKLFDSFYIPKLHSVPLSDEHPDASHVFTPLRRALCTLAGRPVNIQATSDFAQFARDVLFDQPYYVIFDREDGS